MCYNILNIIQAGKSMTLQQLRYIVMVAETGTITEAAGKLYISQPSLTNAIHELEKEMNITIFNRTNKGISVSKEGEDFLSYARQILEQAAILEDRYKGGNGGRKQYCVSTQHYSFAVNAFVDLIKQFGQDEYDFSLRETQTYEIIDPHDVGIDDNSIVLTARSGRAALKNRLQVLGVSLDQQKLDKIYEDFLKLADKKKDINDDDILVLAGADRSQNHRIKLEYLQVTSGVGVRSVASIGLNISGEKFEAAASGNGPVDAAIKALKKIIDRHMTLKEFTIQAISKGSDDMGKVHMQVEYDNRIYYGFGANTDIIAASVEAYIDCINKF